MPVTVAYHSKLIITVSSIGTAILHINNPANAHSLTIKDAEQVALGAACCGVSPTDEKSGNSSQTTTTALPVIVEFDAPKCGKEVQDLDLKAARVHTVVTFLERITKIVDGIPENGVIFRLCHSAGMVSHHASTVRSLLRPFLGLTQPSHHDENSITTLRKQKETRPVHYEGI